MSSVDDEDAGVRRGNLLGEHGRGHRAQVPAAEQAGEAHAEEAVGEAGVDRRPRDEVVIATRLLIPLFHSADEMTLGVAARPRHGRLALVVGVGAPRPQEPRAIGKRSKSRSS